VTVRRESLVHRDFESRPCNDVVLKETMENGRT